MSDEAYAGDFVVPTDQFRTIDPRCFAVESFHFTCGEGLVKISLRDGSVSFENCTPPEAAIEFWRAVTNAFPSVAQGIHSHAQ